MPKYARIRKCAAIIRGRLTTIPSSQPRARGGIAPRLSQLPTPVGFCMYVRRAGLEAVGRFDEGYGLGYGEENDFCRRLATAGFRNVLLDDTFIAHVGNRSFDAKKAALGRSKLPVADFALSGLPEAGPGVHCHRPSQIHASIRAQP